jgi:hypothetical protein
MTEHDNEAETRLREMFRDAADRIHPARPAPEPGLTARAPRTARRSTWGLSIGLAVCVAVAAAVALDVHAFGGSSTGGLGAGNGATGALLTVDTDGSVVLLAPDTGVVLRTLVGPSPVDSSGRHLGRPDAITAAGQVAYVAYNRPSPVIESIPFTGGTPHYVTSGYDPAASPDGSELAFFRLADSASASESVSGMVVVRDLATGSEQTVDTLTGFGFVEALSWSPDGTELAMSGTFMPDSVGPLSEIAVGVQLLVLGQTVSGTNPHFLGTPATVSDIAAGTPGWSDGQFLGSGGDLAVLAGNDSGGVCRKTRTSVLSVDPTTGRTTTVATVPFLVSHAVFDPAGTLIALQRTLPPDNCHVITTTTTSTTSTTVPGLLRVGSSSTGGSFVAIGPNRSVLDEWSAGSATKLADDVAAVTYVAQGP